MNCFEREKNRGMGEGRDGVGEKLKQREGIEPAEMGREKEIYKKLVDLLGRVCLLH